MPSRTLIGIDIGTTSVKAVLTDLAGRRIAAFAARYPTQRPRTGFVQQDPADWHVLVLQALAAFAAHPDLGALQAIGFTGQINTHVFADAHLGPIYPAIVWQDGRAVAEGAALDAQVSMAQMIAWLGAPLPLDASHALPRMAWMARHAPMVWHLTAHVMAPKDWVIARLTGQVRADPISSVGLVGSDLCYAQGLLALVPGAAQRLAPLTDPLSLAGTIGPGQPCAGVPVVRGTMDAWASLFGVGVAEPGQAMYLSGTSEVMGLVSPHRVPVPGAITFPEWAGITLHAGPTQAGGASLDWVAALLGRDARQICDLAGTVAIRPDNPLFLPHLEGERAPLWDAAARGCFAGLTGRTGAPQLAAAVLEGVAFSARLALEALERSGDMRAETLSSGGGGSASDVWCQIRANVLGRPLVRMQALDAGAVGAAVMAGVGCGAVPSLAAATRELVHEDRTFLPDPAAAVIADRRFAIYKELYQRLRPINATLGMPE